MTHKIVNEIENFVYFVLGQELTSTIYRIHLNNLVLDSKIQDHTINKEIFSLIRVMEQLNIFFQH